MREKIKKQLLHNLLLEVSKRYDYIMEQNARIFEETNYKAIHDELTGLYNRFYFIEQLKKALYLAQRHQRYGAVLFIDLDNFKVINDTTGHKAGDALLKMIAKKLKNALREEDVLARFGGDEFVVLIEDLGEDEGQAVKLVRRVVDKLLSSIAYGHIVDQKVYQVTASIGIALFHHGEIEIDDILRYADSAMYEAKRKGKSQAVFFNPMIEERLQRRLLMETSIRQGIDEGEFFLVYQPQIKNGRIIGAEALVRWNNAERGVIPPSEFIAFAEESRLIIMLGEWILQEACKTLKRWEKDPILKNIKLSVNCSAIEVMESDFEQKLMRILTRYGIGRGKLCLEITESLLMSHHASLADVIHRLSEFGLKIALDDFGTGYSSLAYLKSFPINILKIDRSFIEDIYLDRSDQTLVQAIVSVAEDFDMQVVAEGVENKEQEQAIRAIADHIVVQGFLYGKPLPLEAFETAVKERSAEYGKEGDA